MALRTSQHSNFSQVDDELRNIDREKEDGFVWNATRAPNSGDKNKRVWVYKNGATLSLYLFDSVAGAWRGPVNFT